MGRLIFFYRFKGGGVEKHCTWASLYSHTVEDLIRIRGQVWKMLMLERVWSAGLAKAKDQEGQTTGVGHPRGMWLQWRIVHNTLSHEMFNLTPLKHSIKIVFLFNLSWDVLSLNLSSAKHFKHQHFSVIYFSCRIVLQIKNFMLTRLLVNRLLVNIAYTNIWVHLTFVLVHLRKKKAHQCKKLV